MLGGMASEAISAVPVRANTRSISGNFCFSLVSSCFCISTDCVRLVPGIRSAWIAMSPSFRLGMNSLPMRAASTPLNTTKTVAPARISGVRRSATSSRGS